MTILYRMTPINWYIHPNHARSYTSKSHTHTERHTHTYSVIQSVSQYSYTSNTPNNKIDKAHLFVSRARESGPHCVCLCVRKREQKKEWRRTSVSERNRASKKIQCRFVCELRSISSHTLLYYRVFKKEEKKKKIK